VHDNDIGRNIEEILRKLQAAKFTAEHRGYACPVNWHLEPIKAMKRLEEVIAEYPLGEFRDLEALD